MPERREKQAARGPNPDRLKIELDPAEALKRLLTKPPADAAHDDGDEESESDEAARD